MKSTLPMARSAVSAISMASGASCALRLTDRRGISPLTTPATQAARSAVRSACASLPVGARDRCHLHGCMRYSGLLRLISCACSMCCPSAPSPMPHSMTLRAGRVPLRAKTDLRWQRDRSTRSGDHGCPLPLHHDPAAPRVLQRHAHDTHREARPVANDHG